MDLPSEILTLLAKASPWALATYAITTKFLQSPFASILAIRLARSSQERAAYLADRHIECRPVRRRRTSCEGKAEK